jgi:hypothetical protein
MIDDEMRDMLMVSRDTRSAIREMNEAFKGEGTETEYIAQDIGSKIQVQKIVRRVDRVATAKTRALEPILEQQNEY